jgi:hypothetical protein
MDVFKFRNHLDKSLELLLEITRELCYNEISEKYYFIIEPGGRAFHDGLNEFEKNNLIILNKFAGKL